MAFLRRHWRLLLFVLLLCVAAIAYHSLGVRFLPLQHKALEAGWQGMVVFGLVYIAAVTFGLPSMPFQLAAGAIYGIPIGFAIMLVAVNVGAISAFWLARALGRRALEELIGERLENLNQRIEKGGFKMLLILRMLPLVPFNIVNYASGISRLKFRKYFLATVLGIIPMTFVHVALGYLGGNWLAK